MKDYEIWLAPGDAALRLSAGLPHSFLYEAMRLSPRRRGSFLAARALLQVMLAKSTGLKVLPRLEILGGGKPCLPCRQAFFNISDSGSLIAVGLCRRGPVGVDLEQEGRRRNHSVLEKGLLTPAEQAYLNESGELRATALLGLWTMREAALKHSGVGLAGLRKLHVHEAVRDGGDAAGEVRADPEIAETLSLEAGRQEALRLDCVRVLKTGTMAPAVLSYTWHEMRPVLRWWDGTEDEAAELKAEIMLEAWLSADTRNISIAFPKGCQRRERKQERK